MSRAVMKAGCPVVVKDIDWSPATRMNTQSMLSKIMVVGQSRLGADSTWSHLEDELTRQMRTGKREPRVLGPELCP